VLIINTFVGVQLICGHKNLLKNILHFLVCVVVDDVVVYAMEHKLLIFENILLILKIHSKKS
jgi:hypothetical protein